MTKQTKHPSPYTKEYLDEITNKGVEISIGDTSSIEDANNTEDIFTYKGKIVSFSLADNDPNVPAEFYFYTDNGAIKHFNFAELKNIRLL